MAHFDAHTITIAVVFVVVYLGMILGALPFLQLDRPGIALLGAIALVGTEVVGLDEAWDAIHAPTLILLFAFIVIRVLGRAKAEPDPFRALSMSGLAVIFGLQAVINMGVNVSLLPAKGMTLPFISYGGSSLMSMAFAMGKRAH